MLKDHQLEDENYFGKLLRIELKHLQPEVDFNKNLKLQLNALKFVLIYEICEKFQRGFYFMD